MADSRISENLSVSMVVEGAQLLSALEEQALLDIAHEALNNILKHAHTDQAQVHQHLVEPCWMEIEAQSQGFDLQEASKCNRMGFISM